MEKKTIATKMYGRLGRLVMIAAAGSLVFSSCKDEYIYDDKEPEWLGSSIYGELQQRGNFTTFLKIIEDCGEAQTLSLTGSKTLFVASDEAFDRFYKSDNEWGIKSFEDFSQVQKNLLLKFSMVNNAYLIETLSNYNSGGLKENAAMRRRTSVTCMDTVPYLAPANIPDRKFWSTPGRLANGMYMWEDFSDWTMVYFLQKQLDYASITDDDVETFLGVQRSYDDAHIFDKKVIERDITCKNGYLQILEDVLIPPSNMGQHINKDEATTVFARQMDRFAVPMYYSSYNNNYKSVYPEFTDSIFTKRYLAENGGISYYPDGTDADESLFLPFDPCWNTYVHNVSGYALQSDMAAMFVPTDAAMNEYFNVGGVDGSSGSKSAGALLMERFGSIDSIPDNIMVKLIKRHMMPSFVNAVPSKFSKLIDTENSEFPVTKEDIDKSYIGMNGIVYHVNKVFPPDIYSSVVAPVLFSDQTAIMNKAIEDYGFQLYLNSMAMDGMEGYSLLVPTDLFMKNYIDPIAYGSGAEPASLRFVIDTLTGGAAYQIAAVVHKYDPVTHTVGDSITKIPANSNNASSSERAFIQNRLEDIIDTHIIVEDITKGGYFLSKGGQMVYVEGHGENMSIQGGGDIVNDNKIKVVREGGELYAFNQANGSTYFVDKPIETPNQSVYKVLRDNDGQFRGAFSMFFELCEGFTDKEIFLNDEKKSGIDYNVKFFNTYNYTVFAPSNNAILKAIEDGMITPWEDTRLSNGNVVKGIESYRLDGLDGDNYAAAKADTLTKILERFVRYHFQDNAVFIDESNPINSLKTNQTATIKLDDSDSKHDTYQNKYYKIGSRTVSDGQGGMTLELVPEIMGSGNYNAKVIKTQDGVQTHNILTRDYIFDVQPSKITSLRNSTFTGSRITTSSVAVVHLIDKVLYFKDDLDCTLHYNSAE